HGSVEAVVSAPSAVGAPLDDASVGKFSDYLSEPATRPSATTTFDLQYLQRRSVQPEVRRSSADTLASSQAHV
ncbi:MAG: hypothetical protein ACR2LE_04940, partial [Nocardioidaceae bacterium]